MATYDEIYKAQKKITDATLAAEKASFNSDVDKATAIATQNAAKAEETTKQGYEDVFRKNRLNQIINEEKAKERMINLGLTDSGLNRTQQTAIQLQAANADAAAARNRQAAVDEIRRGIAEFTAQQEAKKNDYSRERTSYWDAQAASNAASIYNEQVEKQSSDQKALMSTLGDASIPSETKIAMLHQFANDYYDGDIGAITDLIKHYGLDVSEDASGGKEIVDKSAFGTEIGGFELLLDKAGGFKPERIVNDDFKIKVGNDVYRIEERGVIASGTPIYDVLNKTTTDETQGYNLINYNGELYLKVNNITTDSRTKRKFNNPKYYNLGNGNWLGTVRNGAYDRLKKQLGITTTAE